MSENNHYYGNTVNMHGGTGNIGMVNHQSGTVGAQASSPALEAAVRELIQLLQELRSNVTPVTAQSIDEALPALAAPASEAPPEDRRRALMTVAGIAATAGAIGQPVLDSVRAVLELIGA
ncbi:hypothetical protein [Streptomyces sp. NPDC006551]|uniref:hypothetical protein n=1 Tax=Streptomyces sp. NPDC006551 TaxID=3157178 RepID=UPI0033A91A33